MRPSYIIASASEGTNLLSRDNLLKVLEVDQYVRKVRAQDGDSEQEVVSNSSMTDTIHNFDSLCYKTWSGRCDAQTILALYGDDPNQFVSRPLAVVDGLIWTPDFDEAYIYDVMISKPTLRRETLP
eukprot:Filipodium_phascolosomae@DN8232_c0_g1_i1.p1